MGYYSKVAIRCGEEAKTMFLNAMAAHHLRPNEVYKDESTTLFIFGWTKWYEEFEEVQAINRVMQELAGEDTPELGFTFVRIGEDTDDTEVLRNFCGEPICIYREIEIPDEMEEVS